MNIVEEYNTLYDVSKEYVLVKIITKTDNNIWSDHHVGEIFVCVYLKDYKIYKVVDPHYKFYNTDCFIDNIRYITIGKVIEDHNIEKPINWEDYLYEIKNKKKAV